MFVTPPLSSDFLLVFIGDEQATFFQSVNPEMKQKARSRTCLSSPVLLSHFFFPISVFFIFVTSPSPFSLLIKKPAFPLETMVERIPSEAKTFPAGGQ